MVFTSAVPIAFSYSTEIKEMMMMCVRANVLDNKFHIPFSSCALVICENINLIDMSYAFILYTKTSLCSLWDKIRHYESSRASKGLIFIPSFMKVSQMNKEGDPINTVRDL